MDVYKEALNYLESYNISVEEEVYPELEEDVFHEDSYLHSPLQSDCVDLPDTPTLCSPEALLEKRLTVLKAILQSEELYLCELETLLTPMKALKASAGTSQPVLSSQQVQTVFYQVPELRDLHRDFYTGLRSRLEAGTRPQPGAQSDQGAQVGESQSETSSIGSEMKQVTGHGGFQLTVGDLFLNMVSQLRVYRGFIDNYESALEIVRKGTQTNQCFRKLSQSMMSCNGIDKSRTSYTFEALLYKPLERVTKTTLVLHDLLSTTPPDHSDHTVLQEALRLSRGFLSALNEGSHCKREVTLSYAMRRQVIRDGFVVDVSEGGRNLRHLFLYTDLLLCVKMKGGATGKQTHYRFCWYLPLAGLKLQSGAKTERWADTHLRIQTLRAKMFQLRQELQHSNTGLVKGLAARNVEKSKRKLEQLEAMLLTLTPVTYLELYSPSGESHMFLPSSLYELEEWREAMLKLTGEDVETVPPDLLTLTSSCVKLRMTQQPPLRSLLTEDEDRCLCGTLSVAVQSACGLQQPASVYVSVEVDGYDFYPTQAKTHSSVPSLCPHWHQEFSFRVDGARQLRVMCVRETWQQGRAEETLLGKTSVQLDPAVLQKQWKRQSLSLGQVQLTLFLKYLPHPLDPPSLTPDQPQPIFCVPIGAVALQEGVLVPHVVRCCVEEVERRGMEELGIYRISGALSDISSLKTAFNTSLREAVSKLRSADINAVSGILKLYFRELPQPLIPTELFLDLSTALNIRDMGTRISTLLSLLQSCPAVNINTFFFLLHHLKRVADKQEMNKMPLMNLATVFGPTLLRPPVATLGDSFPRVDISQEVVVQVQVVFFCLQCDHLPAAWTSMPHDSEEEAEEDTEL